MSTIACKEMEGKPAEATVSDNMKSYVDYLLCRSFQIDSLLQELCNFRYDKVYRR